MDAFAADGGWLNFIGGSDFRMGAAYALCTEHGGTGAVIAQSVRLGPAKQPST